MFPIFCLGKSGLSYNDSSKQRAAQGKTMLQKLLFHRAGHSPFFRTAGLTTLQACMVGALGSCMMGYRGEEEVITSYLSVHPFIPNNIERVGRGGGQTVR